VNIPNVVRRVEFSSDRGHPANGFGRFGGKSAANGPLHRGLTGVVNLFGSEMEQTEWQL
jgi:hypothetical protein